MIRFYYTGIASIIILLLLVASPSKAQYPATPPSAKEAGARLAKVRVIRVHDGDTVSIRMRGGDRREPFTLKNLLGTAERVRLIGIDAPELQQDPWGRQAKRYLKKLLSENDWLVSIETDVVLRDKYGRLLAYLWGKDGRMLNERMIESGHAVLLTIPPNVKYAERFATAQKRAESLRAGIWKNGGLRESPYEWRKKHPRHSLNALPIAATPTKQEECSIFSFLASLHHF